MWLQANEDVDVSAGRDCQAYFVLILDMERYQANWFVLELLFSFAHFCIPNLHMATSQTGWRMRRFVQQPGVPSIDCPRLRLQAGAHPRKDLQSQSHCCNSSRRPRCLSMQQGTGPPVLSEWAPGSGACSSSPEGLQVTALTCAAERLSQSRPMRKQPHSGTSM